MSRVLMKFYYVKNIFDLHPFDNETTTMKFFEISTCTVVHYANLNSSFLNKHYLRAVEYAISSYLCLF